MKERTANYPHTRFYKLSPREIVNQISNVSRILMVMLHSALCFVKIQEKRKSQKLSDQSGAKGKPNISWSLGHKGFKTGPKKTAEIEPILCDAKRKILCQRCRLPNDIRFNQMNHI